MRNAYKNIDYVRHKDDKNNKIVLHKKSKLLVK